ncbi:MAG: hydantoinase/oxoprolinase family protein [Pseudomonadota bacterium]
MTAQAPSDRVLLGVDTGGTFTDFVALEGGRLRSHKVLSTPAAPERAILQGIEEMALDPARLSLVHGSTVATNAVLENKGVAVAYIANRGLSDVLSIGRQAREKLYDLNPRPPEPPVADDLCFEVDCRLDAGGREVEPLTAADIDGLLEALAPVVADGRLQAVAINFLFAYLDRTQQSHERRLAAAIRQRFPALYVCCSGDVLAEYREYERGIATWMNATVGPLMRDYLGRLAESLAPAPVAVMHSAGGTYSVEEAGDNAVRLLLSGPAGGLMGARYTARAAGLDQLLTFDMGGTSTDVALIDGDVALTQEGRMGRYPVMVPMVDMHTIGAGGGSLARCDAGGVLQVGPESAGADPGPACYGRGGTQPTVTDAHVVLGHLPPSAALGGSMSLDGAAAERAFAPLAEALGVSVIEAASGVIRLANEHMARALRVISLERGVDLADFALTSFGGAGGLHVCALAELMDLPRALVPANGGVLSALGMLAAPRQGERSLSVRRPLADCRDDEIESLFSQLDRDLLAAMPEVDQRALWRLDLRYAGQSSSLSLPFGGDGLSAAAEAFHREHRARYGHDLDLPLELVTLRVLRQGPSPDWPLPSAPQGQLADAELGVAPLASGDQVPCYRRERLPEGSELAGPCIVLGDTATTWVERGWRAQVDGAGNLHLSFNR